MGRGTSRPDFEEMRIRYEVISRDDSNSLTYLKDKRTRREYMLKQLFVNDEASAKHIEGELQRKKQLYHEHVALLKEYYINLNEQFCSRMYSSGALYELPMRTLEDERKDRAHNRLNFDENELWSILASCILGFGYLQRNYIQHESVRASNLYVEDNGTIKVADPFAKQLPTNYELYRQGRGNANIYLSPAQLRSIREQHKFAVHNPYKSDVFSFAVVVLELAFLEQQSDLYQRSRGTLNERALKDKLERVGRTYGEQLKQLLTLMVSINESERPDWVHLEGLIKGNNKATEGKRHLSRIVSPKQPIKYSSNSQTGTKPQTAEFNLMARQPTSGQKLFEKDESASQKIHLSPPLIKYRKQAVAHPLETPQYRMASGAVTPIHGQQRIESVLQRMQPTQRTIRVSQPPMRTGQDNSFCGSGSQTPNRPPTEYIPQVVSVFHQEPYFQQPFISNTRIPAQLNMTSQSQVDQQKSRTLNISHSVYNENQHPPQQQIEAFHIPTQKMIGPPANMAVPRYYQQSPNQLFQSHHTHQSNSQRAKAQERHPQQVMMANHLLRQPTVQVVRISTDHPTPTEVLTFSPARIVQPFSIPESAHTQQRLSEEERLKPSPSNSSVKPALTIERADRVQQLDNPKNRQLNVPLSIDAMEVSACDLPCSQIAVPHCVYQLKTKIDENSLDEKQGSQQHSFLSESESAANHRKSEMVVNYRADSLGVPMREEQAHKDKSPVVRASNNSKMEGRRSSAAVPPRDIVNESKGSQSRIPVSPPTSVPPPTFYKKPSTDAAGEVRFVKEVYKQGSRYEGEKWKGMRHGKGRFFYDDGGMYDGSWNLNRMEGFGKLYYIGGSLAYEGNWYNDHFEGHGKLYNEYPKHVGRFDYRSFDNVEDYWKTYEGEFRHDLKNGRGVLILQNGQRYEGNFRDDQVHGEGVWKGKDGFVRGVWDRGQLLKVLN